MGLSITVKNASRKEYMKFKLIVSISVAVLLGIGAIIRRQWSEPKLKINIPKTHYHGYDLNHAAIQKAKTWTVLISVEGFGGIGRGTGVLIDEDHILTCAHMIEDGRDDYWIYPYPGVMVAKGKPVFANKAEDLAIFELDTKIKLDEYASFDEAHYDGEPITIIGNTLGAMRWFVTFGVLSGEWESYLLTDGVLYGGNSGGPWIDEKGDIVALTDWTLLHKGKESEIHGGISSKTIHQFLVSYKDSKNFAEMLKILISDSTYHKNLRIEKEKHNL